MMNYKFCQFIFAIKWLFKIYLIKHSLFGENLGPCIIFNWKSKLYKSTDPQALVQYKFRSRYSTYQMQSVWELSITIVTEQGNKNMGREFMYFHRGGGGRSRKEQGLMLYIHYNDVLNKDLNRW